MKVLILGNESIDQKAVRIFFIQINLTLSTASNLTYYIKKTHNANGFYILLKKKKKFLFLYFGLQFFVGPSQIITFHQ